MMTLCTPGWKRPGLLLFLLGMAACATAAPLITLTRSKASGKLSVSMIARQLPHIRTIDLVLGYNHKAVDMADAIVSSPVKATAFAARLDTSRTTLHITVVAMESSVKIGNGSRVSSIQIPMRAQADASRAVTLDSAWVTDAGGKRINVAIAQVTGRRPSAPAHVNPGVQAGIHTISIVGRSAGRAHSPALRIMIDASLRALRTTARRAVRRR